MQNGFGAADKQKEDGQHHVHQAELLVVDRDDPRVQCFEPSAFALAWRRQVQRAVELEVCWSAIVSLYFSVSR